MRRPEVHVSSVRVAAAVLGLVVLGLWSAGDTRRGLDPSVGLPLTDVPRAAHDWMNPSITVCESELRMSVRSLRRINDVVEMDDLRRSLIELPIQAWPYGRVVWIQYCSFGSDFDAVVAKVQSTRTIVRGLGLRWVTGSI